MDRRLPLLLCAVLSLPGFAAVTWRGDFETGDGGGENTARLKRVVSPSQQLMDADIAARRFLLRAWRGERLTLHNVLRHE